MESLAFCLALGLAALRGDALLEFSGRFGEVPPVISRHVSHPESPSDQILRLSNQAARGVVGVGPAWHQDGATERRAFSHLLLHALSVPKEGAETQLAHLGKAFEHLPPDVQEQWSRMASVNAYSGAVHPLVHRHPISGQKVLFLHLGQTGALISWNHTGEAAPSGVPPSWQLAQDAMVPELQMPLGYRTLTPHEATEVLQRYEALLERPELQITHRYQVGDLLLLDNLMVAHRAVHRENFDGLRLLHRTTLRGTRNLDAEGLPPFLYIFGPNPFDSGLWQSADYYGVGFRWNISESFRN
ncbi:Hypothetical protein SCF082_LOCUS14178 [Durusdinium trenchii]|uniref:TauD/TfdA-like domain-containing protein n=1 Tax=Durusdinium trenchii TaxID=1381693 RepID=A0ABP0JW03_9DINO